MKPYIKTYFKYFGYDETDAIFCEVCGKIAQDLHHIQARGMGGSKYRDNIENIMALCRPCHEFYGDKKQHKDFLIITHQIQTIRCPTISLWLNHNAFFLHYSIRHMVLTTMEGN